MLKNGAAPFLSALEQSPLIEDEEATEKRHAESFNDAIGSLNKADGYNCPHCRNKGWIMDYFYESSVKYWTTAVHECSCMAMRKAVQDKKQSGLNASGRYTFENYRENEQWQKSVKAAALAFLDALDSGHWFFIGGQSGAGKSHICTAIANACIDRGRRAKYMIWGEEIKRLKGLIATDPAQYETIMKELKSVPVLYIDDLFKGGRNDAGGFKPPTEADVKGAFDIINARYNNPRCITIISSERMLNEILELDTATGGRIAERAGDYIINLPSDNRMNYRVNKTLAY